MHETCVLTIFQWIFKYIFISAGQLLIAINHIQIKSFCLYNICTCTVYIYYVYIYKYTHI